MTKQKEALEQLDAALKTISHSRALILSASRAAERKSVHENLESAAIRIEMVRNAIRTGDL